MGKNKKGKGKKAKSNGGSKDKTPPIQTAPVTQEAVAVSAPEPEAVPDVVQYTNIGMESDDLEALLSCSTDEEENEEVEIPDRIRISKGALDKANAYARIIKRLGGTGYEWYGFPIVPQEATDDIITDIFLARDQTVSSSHVSVDGADVARAAEEILERKYKIIGWTHCHGDHGTFHSGTDDENIYTVLNSVSLETEQKFHKKLDIFSGAIETKIEGTDGSMKLVMEGNSELDGRLEYMLSDDEKIKEVLEKAGIKPNGDAKELAYDLLQNLLNVADTKVKQARIIGTACSIVVNAAGAQPHTELAYMEEDILTGEKSKYKKVVPLDVVEIENDVTFTEAELAKEIREKISFPRPVRRKRTKRTKQKRTKKTRWTSKILPDKWGSWFGFDEGLAYPDEDEIIEGATPQREYSRSYEHPGSRISVKTKKAKEECVREERNPRIDHELKDLIDDFVLEFASYATATEGKYNNWADDVLSKIVSRESTIIESLKDEELKKNKDKYEQKTNDNLLDCMACNFYSQIHEEPDKELLRFMNQFVKNEEKEAVIEEFAKCIAEGVEYKPYDPEEEREEVITKMAAIFTDYSQPGKGTNQYLYGYWLRKFNRMFGQTGDFNQALLDAGIPDADLKYITSKITQTRLEIEFEDALNNNPELIEMFKEFIATKEEKGLLNGMIDIAGRLKEYYDTIAPEGTTEEEKKGKKIKPTLEETTIQGIDNNANIVEILEKRNLDVDEYAKLLVKFGEAFTRYADDWGLNGNFQYWAGDVVKKMKSKEIDFLEAAVEAGELKYDERRKRPSRPYAGQYKYAKETIAADGAAYPEIMVAFMQEFTSTRGRGKKDEIVKQYIPLIQRYVEEKSSKDMQGDIDELLTQHNPKEAGKDGGKQVS